MAELMSATDVELSLGGQLLGGALVGIALGALLPHPFTPSRLSRTAEAGALGIFFALMFLVGVGALDRPDATPLPIAVAGLGLLLYSTLLQVLGRTRVGPMPDRAYRAYRRGA